MNLDDYDYACSHTHVRVWSCMCLSMYACYVQLFVCKLFYILAIAQVSLLVHVCVCGVCVVCVCVCVCVCVHVCV